MAAPRASSEEPWFQKALASITAGPWFQKALASLVPETIRRHSVPVAVHSLLGGKKALEWYWEVKCVSSLASASARSLACARPMRVHGGQCGTRNIEAIHPRMPFIWSRLWRRGDGCWQVLHSLVSLETVFRTTLPCLRPLARTIGTSLATPTSRFADDELESLMQRMPCTHMISTPGRSDLVRTLPQRDPNTENGNACRPRP